MGEGISNPQLFFRQVWQTPRHNIPVVTSICDPRPWKGLEDLVAAFDIARNRQGLICGRTVLSSFDRPAWIPKWLEWQPAIDRAELARSIAGSTLFVLVIFGRGLLGCLRWRPWRAAFLCC